ncbi:hypothetical protein ACE6JH_00035 [Streptomyces nigra]
MKPLVLALTGFRSYPSLARIDFTGKSLVAALGDTGAGKAACSTPSSSPCSAKAPGMPENPGISSPMVHRP